MRLRCAPAILALLVVPHAAAAASRLAVLTLGAPWSPDCQGTGWRKDRVLLERCTVLETLADEARAGALAGLEGRDVDVMTRENTAQLLKDMGAGASCSEGECEVETAKLIGADYVVSGNLVLIERTWFVTMKLHEVRTARLLRTSERLKGRTQVDLVEALRPAAEAMVRAGLRPPPPRAATGVPSAAAAPPAPGPGEPPAQPPPSWGAGEPREEMARIAGGAFTMGRRGDAVIVAPFLLDVREVTVAAYGSCVKRGKCSADGLACGEGANFADARRGEHPVNCVSWFQANEYCAASGGRLPTEEEWEWAARGGARGTSYPWGDQVPQDQLCWDGDGSDVGRGRRTSTCPAGSFPRGTSPEGVKDLAGNVWEWTSSSMATGKVTRGGSWFEVDAYFVTGHARSWEEPSRQDVSLGFRCAKSL
jgi:formylglycine-generating enzyme required for sulfatase activity